MSRNKYIFKTTVYLLAYVFKEILDQFPKAAGRKVNTRRKKGKVKVRYLTGTPVEERTDHEL